MSDNPYPEIVVSDTARLREDFDLYANRARLCPESNDSERWHRNAKRAQEIIVAASAIEAGEEPGDIAEMMALMSGNPVEMLRRLVVSHGLEVVEEALAEVRDSLA